MKIVMSVLATYLILLSGCDRNDLCYDHPHENLHVAVVWDSVPAELQTSLPEGVRISMYAVQQARQEQSGSQLYLLPRHLWRGCYRAERHIQLPAFQQ
ncbi:hypothetical protein NXX20_17610 [Bacteroides stercoris]|nr:hypothetical protein [Bacteroides stercoris]